VVVVGVCKEVIIRLTQLSLQAKLDLKLGKKALGGIESRPL
jgi:hypothetical protein